MRPVHVRWVDSGRSDGWESVEDSLKSTEDDSMLCESLGWLLAETDRYVLIAGSRKGDEEVLNALQIPKVAIVSMTGTESVGLYLVEE